MKSKSLLKILKSMGNIFIYSHYVTVFLLLVFFLASSIWIFNTNSRDITHGVDDEYHTLVHGTRLLSPFEESAFTVRVGEMNRWFVRLLYPVGVYYMNSHMGGELSLTGWEYPGGYYLKKEFKNVSRIQYDPNIQDYVFSMRLGFGVMAICSFCMVIWALFNRVGFPAAVIYGTLILSSSLVFEQFRIFYSETTLFLIFNTVTFLCLTAENPTYRTTALLGILSAAALSTKLTGVLIVAPVFAYIAIYVWNRSWKPDFRIEIYLLFTFAFLILINLKSESIFSFINETLANVYHYKTGHFTTENGGMEFLSRILVDLGYVSVLLFIASLIYLVKSPKWHLVPVYVLGIMVIFAIFSFVDSAVYMIRNAAFIYVSMSLIVAFGSGIFLNKLRNKEFFRICSLFFLAIFIWMAGTLVREMPSLSRVFFERTSEKTKECSNIGTIGLSKNDLLNLNLNKKENVDVFSFENIKGPFNISEDHQKIFGEYLHYDCLVVYREGQNKQVSNFFAPQFYRISDRVGNWFFFERKNR